MSSRNSAMFLPIHGMGMLPMPLCLFNAASPRESDPEADQDQGGTVMVSSASGTGTTGFADQEDLSALSGASG